MIIIVLKTWRFHTTIKNKLSTYENKNKNNYKVKISLIHKQNFRNAVYFNGNSGNFEVYDLLRL